MYEKYKFGLCEAIYFQGIGNRTPKYFLNKRRKSYFFEDLLNKLKSKNSISNMLTGLNNERNGYKL